MYLCMCVREKPCYLKIKLTVAFSIFEERWLNSDEESKTSLGYSFPFLVEGRRKGETQ